MAHESMYAIWENKSLAKLNTLFYATVPTSGWSSSAPYTQTVSVEGMLECYNVSYAPDVTEETTSANEDLYRKEVAYFSTFETLDGQIKITCKKKKPTADLPLVIKIT